ncbi:hypothetical protein CZ787_01195 [Halomonas citrativorans]|uniref:Uncharacterized protein n=1 Tax=Halomonas citrativorans TaxID=2742612 RepID=A0A1R4HPL5_9GAMM|nr:hypothetical protein CZ787_01195 [Halomonas citrativorans]
MRLMLMDQRYAAQYNGKKARILSLLSSRVPRSNFPSSDTSGSLMAKLKAARDRHHFLGLGNQI